MAGKLTRRDLLKGQFNRERDLSYLNYKWPTKKVAKVIKRKLADTPPVSVLPANNEAPHKLKVQSTTAKLKSINWNQDTAAHLLRRTTFAPTYEEIENAANSTLEDTVEQLLADRDLPSPPGDWIDESAPDWNNLTEQDVNELVETYFERHDEMRNWWMNLMSSNTLSIRETLTLFWHDHFATGADKVFYPQAVYEQNNVLRENCLGDFKAIVRKISFGPAMMIWLDTVESTKDALNENFAREILELFTLGVDNYTQTDIIEASRAFTGYTTNGVNTNYDYDSASGNTTFWNHYYYNHDYTEKTFLGQTGTWNGDDIINIIFEQDALAYFICKKIYQWFLYEHVDEDFINNMANVFRTNSYSIKSVMEYLLTSEHFYDAVFRGAKIKNPLVLVQGTIRQFELNDKTFPEDFLISWQWFLGMMPLEPPDVSGWPGYRSWLNSITLPIRKIAAINFLEGEGWEDLGFRIDVKQIAKSTSDHTDAETLVEDLATLMFAIPLTETLKNNLLNVLLDGMSVGEWSIDAYGAEERLQNLFRYMMRLPEYQLV